MLLTVFTSCLQTIDRLVYAMNNMTSVCGSVVILAPIWEMREREREREREERREGEK